MWQCSASAEPDLLLAQQSPELPTARSAKRAYRTPRPANSSCRGALFVTRIISGVQWVVRSGEQTEHRLHQLLAGERLGQERVDQLLRRASPPAGLRLAEDKENGGVGPAAPHLSGNVEPAEVGQAHVEDDDIGPVHQQRERLRPASGRGHGETLFPEDASEQAANLRLVVYHDRRTSAVRSHRTPGL